MTVSILLMTLPVTIYVLILWVFKNCLISVFGHTIILITPEKISRISKALGITYGKYYSSIREDITEIEIGGKRTALRIWAGARKYEIQEDEFASEMEMEWLASELAKWLNVPINYHTYPYQY